MTTASTTDSTTGTGTAAVPAYQGEAQRLAAAWEATAQMTASLSGVPAGLHDPTYLSRMLQEHHASDLAQLEQAVATFEERRGRLYDEHHRQLFAAHEHARRLGEHLTAAELVFAKVERAAGGALERANRELTLLASDPADALSKAELEQANLRRPFVAEDSERLRLPELAARVKAVLEGGSRPLCFLWARAVEQRLAALATQAGPSGQPPNLTPPDREAWRELSGMLEPLKRTLVDPGNKREAAERRALAANALRGRVAEARAVVGSQAPALDTAYARHLWSGRR